MGAALGIIGLFYVAILVFYIYCMWKIYVKAGQPGWAAIIPIYNYVVLLQIVGKPVWWIFLMFIPLVNIVIGIIVISELSKAFGKGAGFTLGLIFLGFIFIPILALGDAQYKGNKPVDASMEGILDAGTN